MHSSKSFNEQFRSLSELATQTQPTEGELALWHQSTARSGYRPTSLLDPLKCNPISSVNSIATTEFRKQKYAEEAPPRFISELQRLLARDTSEKSRAALISALQFWRVYHLRVLARRNIVSHPPPLSPLEKRFHPPAFLKQITQAYERLFPRTSAHAPPRTHSVNSPSPATNPAPPPPDASREDCFSFSAIVPETTSVLPRPFATSSRHIGTGKRRSIRCKKFTSDYIY